MKILITSDSSCDLNKEQLEEYNIQTLPLYVNLNGEEFQDGVNITPQDIFAFVKENKKLPKTSALSVADYITFFKTILEKNKDAEIIHIGLSSGLSTSYNNAVSASKEFDNVSVIDGKNLSTGTGLLVLSAAKLAKEGYSKQSIISPVSLSIYLCLHFFKNGLWSNGWLLINSCLII